MKILHICAIGFTVKTLLIPQIDYLISKNLSVEIACSPGVDVDELQKRGYVIHPIEISRRISPFSNLISIYKLAKLMRMQRYDAIHVHTSIASVLGRFAAQLAGIKTVIYSAHGFYFHQLTPPLEYFVFQKIEAVMAKVTDLIFTANYEDIDMIKRTKLCPIEKVRYIGSDGVDLERFNPQNITCDYKIHLKQSLNIPKNAQPIIGTVGRFTEKKGSAYLIEAVAQLRSTFPDIHVLIIGGRLTSDPDKFQSDLIDRIHVLDLERNISLIGFREDIPELIGLMDVFTLPTFTHEGLPTVVIEAMAMEKPVVATDVRGCREAIIDGTTGLIVPPQDPQRLAQAIKILLEDPQRCQQMGLAGRQRVEAEYDVKLVLQRLAKGYETLGLLPAS